MDYFSPKEKTKSEQASDYLDSLSASASAAAKDAQFQAEGLLGTREKTAAEEMSEQYDACCPALSYQSRVVGFCLCFFTGLVLMFLADTKISAMLAGNPTPFGVYYTFGNLVAIVGSFFLSGPTAQFNKMTEGSRIVSSAVYLLALAATLFFALDDSLPKTPRLWCLLAAILVQYLALLWYTLSFVPFAQAYVCAFFKACCGDLFNCGGCCDEGGCCGPVGGASETSPLTGF